MIIFGTKGREEPRGIVADICPSCQEIRAFAVIDQFEVAHIYFVSMGQGKLLGTSMRCLECRTVCHFDANKYREIMPCSKAENSNLEELVSRTHPRLLAALPASARIPASAPPPPERSSLCASCGYRRERPFRYCPACGLHC